MSETSVEYSYGVAIRVRVLGPTTTQGSRLRVWRSDSEYREDPHKLTVSWDHELNDSDNAVAAVRAYLAGISGDYADSWTSRSWFVAGANATEWIAVAKPLDWADHQ